MAKNPNKRITTIYVDNEVWEHLEFNEQVTSLSEWVNDHYKEMFMRVESETEKLAYYLNEAERCKENIKLLKEGKVPDLLNKEELNWISKDGKQRLERGFDEKGVLRFFNDRFKRTLTMRQFKIIMERETDGRIKN